MPLRSLKRLVADMAARPRSESVVAAFVNATRDANLSDDERTVQDLASRFFKRWPDRWRQAIARMHPTAHEFFETMISERMEVSGEDPSLAPMIAAVLNAITNFASSEDLKDESNRGRRSPDSLERAIKDTLRVLGR